jgi:hypothetical protein
MRPTSFLALSLVAASAGAVVLGVGAGVARAEPDLDETPLPRPVRLENVRRPGTQSCADAETIGYAISARGPRNLLDPAAPARLIVTLSRQGIKYTATAEVRDAEGASVWMRPFTPLYSCDVLVMDIGLVVGERFRPPRLAPVAPVEPAAPPPPPAPAPPKLEPPPPAALAPPKLEPPPAPRAEPLRLNLGIAGALALRTTEPVPAFNLVTDAGFRFRSFSAAVEFRWTPPQVTEVDTTGDAWISAQQFSEAIVPCGHFRAFFYCGLAQVTEVVWRTSPGIMPPPWTMIAAATGTRLGGDVPLPWWERRFAVRLSADVLVTLHHAVIHVNNDSPQAWSTPDLTVALGAGFVTDLKLK